MSRKCILMIKANRKDLIDLFEEKIYNSKAISGGHLKYLQYNAAANEKSPLLIYLHGAGSRGSSLSCLNRNAGPLGEIGKGRHIPAVVVAPLCHGDTWFDLFQILSEFIEDYISKENIDKSRVYICGVSMGGYAAWQMAMSHPQWFAALVAVCGGGMYWNASRLKNVPIWAFHGECDGVVFPEESIKLVNAVNACGGNAKITLYPKTEHNSWEQAFSDNEMWQWMFSQIKTDKKATKTEIITGD